MPRPGYLAHYLQVDSWGIGNQTTNGVISQTERHRCGFPRHLNCREQVLTLNESPIAAYSAKSRSATTDLLSVTILVRIDASSHFSGRSVSSAISVEMVAAFAKSQFRAFWAGDGLGLSNQKERAVFSFGKNVTFDVTLLYSCKSYLGISS